MASTARITATLWTNAKGFVVDVALYKTIDVDVTPQAKNHYGRTVLPPSPSRALAILQELLLAAGVAWGTPGIL